MPGGVLTRIAVWHNWYLYVTTELYYSGPKATSDLKCVIWDSDRTRLHFLSLNTVAAYFLKQKLSEYRLLKIMFLFYFLQLPCKCKIYIKTLLVLLVENLVKHLVHLIFLMRQLFLSWFEGHGFFFIFIFFFYLTATWILNHQKQQRAKGSTMALQRKRA